MNSEPREGELITTGDFRVDRIYMERRIDSELQKIFDEKVLPFSLYLNREIKRLIFLGIWSFWLNILVIWFTKSSSSSLFLQILPLMAFISLVSTVALGWALKSFLSAFLKKRRVVKFFKKISERLKRATLSGHVDIKELQKKFEKRISVRVISPDRAEKVSSARFKRLNLETEKRKQLIQSAKSSNL